MRAPVYRQLDSKQTLLGLAFPSEFLLLLVVVWGALLALHSWQRQVGVIALAYVGLRLLTYGRPPLYLQHLFQWVGRRLVTRGHLSAAARSAQPRFPHAPTAFRDSRRPPR